MAENKLILADKLRNARGDRGFSKAQMANLLRVSRDTYSKWERGKVLPSEANRLNIQRVLNLSTSLPPPRKIVNRVGLLVDVSSSMSRFGGKLREVLHQNLLTLRDLAVSTGQRTDVVINFFSHSLIKSVVLSDLSRLSETEVKVPLPNIYGDTALFDNLADLVSSLENSWSAVGSNVDLAYVVNVLTDGEDNMSQRHSYSSIGGFIRNKVAQKNWTFSFKMPPGKRPRLCSMTGIPVDNVIEWELTEAGLQETQVRDTQAFGGYFKSRSMGLASSNSFYTNIGQAPSAVVDQTLDRMRDISPACTILTSTKDDTKIRDLVQQKGLPFTKGRVFYQLNKPELKVQDYKKLIVTKTGKSGIFLGNQEVRELLGLPKVGTVKITPQDHGAYEIYVQSTSVNRKVPAHSKVIVVSGNTSI